MARHFGLKAEPIIIKTDPTLRSKLWTMVRNNFAGLRFQVRRLLGFRYR